MKDEMGLESQHFLVSPFAFPFLPFPFFLHTFVQWAGRCSNPRLRLFRPPLNRLSYQPRTGLRLEA
jgi:hypothetical protein